MCLKLSTSRKASAKPDVSPAREQLVDAVLDHPPVRQVGELVIIGRAEQLVLERLLLGDVGRARQQQRAPGDADRLVAGQKHLPAALAGKAFLDRHRLAGAKGFAQGVAAIFVRRSRRSATAPPLVGQQHAAVFVLHGDAIGQHPENIAQDAQFGRGVAVVAGRNCSGLSGVMAGAVHGLRLANSVVVFVKWEPRCRLLWRDHGFSIRVAGNVINRTSMHAFARSCGLPRQ